MVHVGHEAVDKLLNGFVKAVSTSLLILLFFILQYIFDMEFQCSCLPGLQHYDVLYLAVPPLILTWVLLYIESFLKRRCCDCRNKFLVNSCSSFLHSLLKFITVGTIWITAVLFDGDWYFCYKTNSNLNYTGMPCKAHMKLRKEEIIIRNELKIDSLEIGLILICSGLLVWTVAELLWPCYIRRKHRKSDGELFCCVSYYKDVYENLLAEQVSSYLKEELTKLAAERAQAICKPHLQAIKDYEKNNCDPNKAEDSWYTISASDFYLQHERKDVSQDVHQNDRDNVPLIIVDRE